MNRRALLAATVTGPVAGCLDWIVSRTAPPRVPDGMAVETRHWVSDVLEDGIWHGDRDSVGSYGTVIPDRKTADERLRSEEAGEFLRETDFEASYLLVVQNWMQSARWLELGRIERTESGLRVSAVTRSPEGPYGDDAAPHSLVICVTDEENGVPETIRFQLDGEPVERSETS